MACGSSCAKGGDGAFRVGGGPQAGTAGCFGIDQEALRSVLEDDGLVVRKQLVAQERLVAWMKGG